MSETDVQPLHLETPAEREARIRHESALIAKAEADIAAGLGIDHDVVEEWLDALDRGENPSMPEPRGAITR
jgi:predicted transcriptional regulator